MSHVFKHPKYYEELRKRNRYLSELQQVKLERSVPQLDQVISWRTHDGGVQRAPGPGLKLRHGGLTPEASGLKLQAASNKQQASSSKLRQERGTSLKPQAARFKLQALSHKLRDA